VGTKNTPGPFDCYASAHPDEPMFVLLGREMMKWAHEHGRPIAGLGVATLAGVMELIRSVNHAHRKLDQSSFSGPTSIEKVRMFLAKTDFEGPGSEAAPC
jgi:hypothetical protein